MNAPALYIPHGGGPLPLLGDPGHGQLIEFLGNCPRLFPRPDAILVISAHWEEACCTVQSGAEPGMLYDYHGFPPASYELLYPAPGAPELASQVLELLSGSGISTRADSGRGFDHGLFVPLSLMYPAADIPCLQLSLVDSLDPADHISIGLALAPLREQGVMILGSGSSFHNMHAFRDGPASADRCQRFDDWLFDACCNSDMATTAARLYQWEDVPEARYAHPREEHLLPLHVCFGAAMGAGRPAERVFNGDMMGYLMSALLWR